MPKTTGPQTVICTYRVKPGKEKAFIGLLERHWPTLRRLDLVTRDPAVVYRGRPGAPGKEAHAAGPSTFIEIFSWKDAEAVDKAHHSPELLQVWEPMGQLCDSMDFPHFERLSLGR